MKFHAQPAEKVLEELCLVFYQIFNVFNCKSEKKSVFTTAFSNKYLLGAAGISIILQVAVTYAPLNMLFDTVPLNIFDWVLVIVVAASIIVYRGIRKAVQK